MIDGLFLYADAVRVLQVLGRIFAHADSLLGTHHAATISLRSIESGSLHIRISIDKHLLDFTKWLLSAIASNVYKRVSTNGKLETLVDRAKFVREIVEKKEELKKFGVTSDRMDDGARAVLDDIGRELQELSSASTGIRFGDSTVVPDDRSLLQGGRFRPELPGTNSDTASTS